MMEFSQQPDAGFISSLINESYDRIQSHLILTPLKIDVDLGLWMKCENLQATGSFKWRGALSKLSALPPGSNIVTASTGNHGLGVAKAGALYGHNVKVFISKSSTS